MNPYMNLLDTLTTRARKGDTAAELQLHRELEPRVIIMVRETMQPGGVKTPLDRRIRAEARRAGLSNAARSSEEREKLIHQVAQDVCRSWLAEHRSVVRDFNPHVDTVGNGAGASLPLAH